MMKRPAKRSLELWPEMHSQQPSSVPESGVAVHLFHPPGRTKFGQRRPVRPMLPTVNLLRSNFEPAEIELSRPARTPALYGLTPFLTCSYSTSPCSSWKMNANFAGNSAPAGVVLTSRKPAERTSCAYGCLIKPPGSVD